MLARQIRLLPLQVYDCRIINERGITRESGTGFYQLVYTKSGRGLLHDDKGNEHILNPGDVVFFSPGARHDYYQQGGEQWVTGYITFDGLSFSDGLTDLIGIPEAIYVFRKSDFEKPEETADMFQRVAEEFAERSYVDDLIMHTLLYRLLYTLYSTIHKNSYNTELSAPPLSGALEYIDKHIGEQLNVKTVAEAVGMKEHSFYKAFKKYLNTTPAEYILNKKLKKAKYLIANTDMTIREIGFEVGMTTPNYLHRTFRAKFGMTPGEYRRHYAKKSEITFSEKNLPVYLTEAGEVTYENEISWENERAANSFSIMLCNSGCGILTDELKNEYFIRPGYLCFLPPDSECALRPYDKPWTLSRVSFNGRYIKKLFNALGFMTSAVIHCDGELTIDHRYCAEITYNFSDGVDALCRYAWDKSPRALLYKSVLLYELITFTGIAGDNRTETTDAETRLAPVVDIINMYYNRDLSLHELAESIGVCSSTLFRLFRVVFKKTPKEYITDVRMNRAKRLLLRHANKSVAEIAEDVGFLSPSHFIAVFRAKYSMTPEEFRAVYFY